MCGRYYVDIDVAKYIQPLLSDHDHLYNYLKERQDIFPSQKAVVIISEDEKLVARVMTWGFPNPMGNGVVFNARSETVLEKRMFRESIKQQRCLVVAKGFYEWDTHKNKITFELLNHNVMFMAGIWNEYKGESCFTILTTEPNQTVKPFHNRMPIVLNEDEVLEWLNQPLAIETILNQKPQELDVVNGILQETLF